MDSSEKNIIVRVIDGENCCYLKPLSALLTDVESCQHLGVTQRAFSRRTLARRRPCVGCLVASNFTLEALTSSLRLLSQFNMYSPLITAPQGFTGPHHMTHPHHNPPVTLNRLKDLKEKLPTPQIPEERSLLPALTAGVIAGDQSYRLFCHGTVRWMDM